MRDNPYPNKSFKLSKEVIKELNELRREEDLSYNMLFKLILNGYKMNKILNTQYYELSKKQLK